MKNFIIATFIVVASFAVSGCSDQKIALAPKKPAQAIDVAMVLVEPVQHWHTYTTRLEAPENVALMPRVSGVIDHIAFNEGDEVKQGDLLVQLDNRPFSAIVDNLVAQVVSSKAALDQAQNEAVRAQRLLERKAMSTEQAESRASVLRQRKAQLKSLQAQLTAAQLDLQFTSVRSPIDGIISRANITKGNNVHAGQSVLTTIVSNKSMYAYFDIDERTWNKSFSKITAASNLQVVMQKIGSDDFRYNGHINFIDNQINPATGTLRVRAIFEKANNELRPGSFARIKLAANTITNQVIVPDRAIGTDLKNRFVLTVGKDNILEYKQVQTGERYGNLRAITSGLQQGDIIAVNGPARVGPGMHVTPKTVTIDSTGIAFRLPASNATNLLAQQ